MTPIHFFSTLGCLLWTVVWQTLVNIYKTNYSSESTMFKMDAQLINLNKPKNRSNPINFIDIMLRFGVVVAEAHNIHYIAKNICSPVQMTVQQCTKQGP